MNFKKKENETYTDYATRYLREQTMNFEILPGTSINEKEISDKLGVSRAPIREALSRLISEELVVFKPGKGFFCRELSVREVEELFEIRQDLEISSIKSAIEKAKDEDIKLLLDKAIYYNENQIDICKDKLVVIDENFHYSLNKLGDNDERVKFLSNINKRIRFVRDINLQAETKRKKLLGEHVTIAQALYNRDLEKTINILTNHLQVNSDELSMNIKDGLAKIYGLDIYFN